MFLLVIFWWLAKSCLRKILRNASDGTFRADYPFRLWESRVNNRSIATNDVAFEWVLEAHGNMHTFGKVLRVIGTHDFLIAKSAMRDISILINDNGYVISLIVKCLLSLFHYRFRWIFPSSAVCHNWKHEYGTHFMV